MEASRFSGSERDRLNDVVARLDRYERRMTDVEHQLPEIKALRERVDMLAGLQRDHAIRCEERFDDAEERVEKLIASLERREENAQAARAQQEKDAISRGRFMTGSVIAAIAATSGAIGTIVLLIDRITQ